MASHSYQLAGFCFVSNTPSCLCTKQIPWTKRTVSWNRGGSDLPSQHLRSRVCLPRGVQPGFEGCCAPAHSGEDRERAALWKTTSKPGRSRTGRHSPACRFPTGEVSPSEARGSAEVRKAKRTAWNLSRELGRVVLGCCGVTGGRQLVNAPRR